MSEFARPAPVSRSLDRSQVSSDDERRREATTVESARGSLQSARGGPLVVLLEDDEDQGALMSHWIGDLLEAGQFRWFRTAAEWFAHADGAPRSAPRLFMCDYELGEMDARSVLERVVGEHAGETAVVVVSAHTDPARRRAALAAGATAWLDKPLSRDAVRRVVLDSIGG